MVCRAVLSSRTMVCARAIAVVSLRGPIRTRCSASSASMSPHNCTRESASRIRWSQTRSMSAIRCEDSTMVSSPPTAASASAARNFCRASGSSAARARRAAAPRPLGQGERQRDLGPLAAGQRAHPLVQRDPQAAKPGPHRIAVPARVEVGADADVVLRGQPPVQRDLLGQEADLGQVPGILARRCAEHGGPARGRRGQPGKQPQQRGLARAVRPDQRGYPALGNADRAVAQRGDPPVPLGQPGGLDRCGVATGRRRGGG